MADDVKCCEICGLSFSTQKTKRTCSKECGYKLRANVRFNIKHEPIEKICASCQFSFFDRSKKKLVTKCATCIKSSGVATRRARDSYKRTEEQNRLHSEKMRAKHAAGEIKLSDEGRKSLSKGLSERWNTEEFREKVKQGYINRYGVPHHMMSAGSKEAVSRRCKGKKLSEEACRNMRCAAAKRIRDGKNEVPFLGKGGFRQDIGIYVRSRWEANFARYLKFTSQEFQYESESFALSDGRTYTPDFKVGDAYFEVKGWWTPKAKEKFDLFVKENSHVNLHVIDAQEYAKIEAQYSGLIDNWERKNDDSQFGSSSK